jgi:tetratricopeptide (TPR) repeat protein
MTTHSQLRSFVIALSLFLLLPGTILADAGGGSRTPTVDPTFSKANMAIQAKDWDTAIELLNTTVAHDATNADAFNLLGYAERQRGNLEAAFKHYEQALALNPDHKGAHEYVGEAYLLVGNLPKAEVHLAKLDKLCFFPCDEYTDLKEAIAEYQRTRTK